VTVSRLTCVASARRRSQLEARAERRGPSGARRGTQEGEGRSGRAARGELGKGPRPIISVKGRRPRTRRALADRDARADHAARADEEGWARAGARARDGARAGAGAGL
jgi:hypothetical protein